MLLHLVRSEELDQIMVENIFLKNSNQYLLRTKFTKKNPVHTPHTKMVQLNKIGVHCYLLNQICQKPFGHMRLWLLYL